jgi:hypothetical protein
MPQDERGEQLVDRDLIAFGQLGGSLVDIIGDVNALHGSSRTGMTDCEASGDAEGVFGAG